MSENYFIFASTPMVTNIKSLITMKMMNRPVVECIDWNPHGVSTLYLISRRYICVAAITSGNLRG